MDIHSWLCIASVSAPTPRTVFFRAHVGVTRLRGKNFLASATIVVPPLSYEQEFQSYATIPVVSELVVEARASTVRGVGSLFNAEGGIS